MHRVYGGGRLFTSRICCSFLTRTRFWIDPFTEDSTLCLIANAVDPMTKEGYWLDPRTVAGRAESYLQFTGIADTIFVGPEAEFFIFDEARFHNDQNSAGFHVNSEEGHWNSGRVGGEGTANNGYHIRAKEGYVPVSPLDSLIDIRNTISSILGEVGISVECHHHEVATAGQCEIDFKYSNLLHTADNLMLFKYVVKNTAHAAGKSATFMPKPLYGDNGSGMHCTSSRSARSGSCCCFGCCSGRFGPSLDRCSDGCRAMRRSPSSERLPNDSPTTRPTPSWPVDSSPASVACGSADRGPRSPEFAVTGSRLGCGGRPAGSGRQPALGGTSTAGTWRT